MSNFPSTLCMGAAQTDITPPDGTQLGGQTGQKIVSKTILDPLQARAVVCESGGRKFSIVALDVAIITAPRCRQIRQAASELTGIAPDAICVHGTQTHNAPPLGGFQFDRDFPLDEKYNWLRMENPEYSDFAVAQSVEAIRQAHENLEPVEIGVGEAIDGRWAFNRRAVNRDDKVFMPGHTPPPLGWTQMKYLEGPVDPAVMLLAARGEKQNPVTALLHHTCHPVHMFWQYDKGIISADWCGAMCDEFSVQTGVKTPVLLNGCCGNINPWNPFDPDYREQPGDHIKMGQGLASSARKILDTLQWTSEAVVDYRIRTIHLPLRELDQEKVRDAREYLRAHPEPIMHESGSGAVDGEWMAHAFWVSLDIEQTREGGLPYEIQAFRLGDAAFVCLPGEPSVEGQLQIKIESPSEYTFVLHNVAQYAGYIAPRASYPRGGHEANLTTYAKVAPGALEMAIEESGTLLRELFSSGIPPS